MTEPLTTSSVQLSARRIIAGTDLKRPLYVTAPPGDTNRLFVVEQDTGKIKIFDLNTETLRDTPFLAVDANDLLSEGFEQGLLGLAFHPDYANNGKFYVNYTAPGGGTAGQTKLVEYTVSSDPNVADAGSARTLLSFNQPAQNHNGGWLGFGPDGYLYMSSGDGGGSGFKPGIPSFADNSQDITDNLLGKILRLNVNRDAFPDDSKRNYAIPGDNPFVGKTGDDEIWVYGLRNPWRPSFDRATGDLYIADVGQSNREEINFQPNSSLGGENYGWNVREGTLTVGLEPLPPNLVDPIYEYEHTGNTDTEKPRSITGGFVYRGPQAALRGTYFFGDYIKGKIWSFRNNNGQVSQFSERTSELAPNTGSIRNIASFGEDAAGNIYVVDLYNGIFKIEASATTTKPSLTLNDTSVLEGKPGVTKASFTVMLSSASDSNVTVNFVTSNNSAIAGSDYTRTTGTLTFNAGQTSKKIEVPILDDRAIEAAETFNLTLSSPRNATIADGSGVGTIEDVLVANTTTTLPNTIESLRLQGNAAINGTGNDNNNRLTGNSSNNNLNGKAGNDRLEGRGGTDTLDGGAGNDTLVGGRGDDTYIVGNSGDVVTENANEGEDLVRSSVSYTLGSNLDNLDLFGTANVNGTGNNFGNDIRDNRGNNILLGRQGNDTLVCGVGNDTLNGGAGSDTLTGGSGRDRFAFSSSSQGKDRITDFSAIDDTIALSAAGFAGGLTAGTLSANRFIKGASATIANHRVIYNSTNGNLLFDRDGSNSAFSAVQIASLASGLTLTNADFFIVA
jgi:Ca2+-binding RTX toxin-like protein